MDASLLSTTVPTIASPLQQAIDQGRRLLCEQQRPDGHWVEELQGDTILESEYIMLLAFLGREHDPVVEPAARYILQQQIPDGGWSNYPEGPLELSVSVKAYFALKIAGHDPQAPSMQRAREQIRKHGGAACCNSFTRFHLALLGQIPYDRCPCVPPEMILLPRWFPFNLYAMSSWTRTIVVPLSIQSAFKPVRQLPEHMGIRELFLDSPARAPAQKPTPWFSWENFFWTTDRVCKFAERWGLFRPLRGWALRRALAWMRERCAEGDGLGAIFPPMIYTVVTLRCLGVADDDPEMQWALRQLEDLVIEEKETVRLQPCVSPVWDTALTLNALADAGVKPDDPVAVQGVSWLLKREIRRPGDWSFTNAHLEPSGWCFEYRNAFYPDTDDTAMVLMALAKIGDPKSVEVKAAVGRALRWLLGLQNQDGGWAAFDRDINWEVLTRVPFADHNAMLDPSCPDITARVLEALGHHGYTVDHPQVRKALAFLRTTQEPCGAWFGRWGVNYVYGTWQVLQGLRAIGYPRDLLVRRAVKWLKEVQQAGGGWGESCASYDQNCYVPGQPTASQTAWAVLGLLAAQEADSDSVRSGIEYLLATQMPNGTWSEEPFTGTGFPKVFYLRYHMYPQYFPLMALARYARLVGVEKHDQQSELDRAS